VPPRFLDTNVLVRHLTNDDPDKAIRALALLERADEREEELVTSPMVIFETIFTLQNTYHASRTAIREGVGAVISLRGLRLMNKGLYLRALDLYVDKNISFADAYNAVFMQSTGLTEIYTWDTDFDRLEGITRVEPAA
jgi:predicted nucleic acid-binding protein